MVLLLWLPQLPGCTSTSVAAGPPPCTPPAAGVAGAGATWRSPATAGSAARSSAGSSSPSLPTL
eukprot:5150020-Alexandrium_andersonii.AAC.1